MTSLILGETEMYFDFKLRMHIHSISPQCEEKIVYIEFKFCTNYDLIYKDEIVTVTLDLGYYYNHSALTKGVKC